MATVDKEVKKQIIYSTVDLFYRHRARTYEELRDKIIPLVYKKLHSKVELPYSTFVAVIRDPQATHKFEKDYIKQEETNLPNEPKKVGPKDLQKKKRILYKKKRAEKSLWQLEKIGARLKREKLKWKIRLEYRRTAHKQPRKQDIVKIPDDSIANEHRNVPGSNSKRFHVQEQTQPC